MTNGFKRYLVLFSLIIFIPCYLFSQTWKEVGELNEYKYPVNGIKGFWKITSDNNGTLYLLYQLNAWGRPMLLKFNGSSWDSIKINNSLIQNNPDTQIVINDFAIGAKDNNVYILCSQYTNVGTRAAVLKYNGTAWSYISKPYFREALPISIAADQNGIPYISLKDPVNGKIAVMKYDGSDWVYVGAPAIGNVLGNTLDYYSSIYLSRSGSPYIATRGESGIEIKKFDGSNWVVAGDLQNEAFRKYGKNVTIAFDKSDVPFISYSYVKYNTEYISTMKLTENKWEYVGKQDFIQGSNPLLKFNAGMPYLIFLDNGKQQSASLIAYKNNSWAFVGDRGFSNERVSFASLAFDKSGEPVVFFSFGIDKIIKYNGAAWVSFSKVGVNDGRAKNVALAIDKNDVPYVIYNDLENKSLATIKKFNGTKWEIIGTPGLNEAISEKADLGIDKDNNVLIAFRDPKVQFALTVKKYDGSQWIVVGSRGFNRDSLPNGEFHLSMDKNGMPYISFLCNSSRNKYNAAVMKFQNQEWVDVGDIDLELPKTILPILFIRNNSLPTVTFDQNSIPYINFMSYTAIVNHNALPVPVIIKFIENKWTYIDPYRQNKNSINQNANGDYESILYNALKLFYIVDDHDNHKLRDIKDFDPNCMAINKIGETFIFYCDYPSDSKESKIATFPQAFVQKYYGYNSAIAGNVGFNAGAIAGVSIVFDSNNLPVIAYANSPNGPVFVRKLSK